MKYTTDELKELKQAFEARERGFDELTLEEVEEEMNIDMAMNALLMIENAKSMLRDCDLSYLHQDDLDEIKMTCNDIIVDVIAFEDEHKKTQYKLPGQDEVLKAYNDMFEAFKRR